ncbi:glycoside hydrolase family 3 protein [Geofilum sp. OHC36d9]|uniref:glycoside hydrolase family 3 protein n=1 Tax=Geofilum sp. OHC36d9 TaxID=3458413 RepID=UPI004033D805
MKLLVALIAFSLLVLGACRPVVTNGSVREKPVTVDSILETGTAWADSVMSVMSWKEQIAQLFWLTVEEPDNASHYNRLKELVITNQPGGLLLMKMSLQKAGEVIDQMQAVCKVPLMVSIDGETGLSMRMPEVLAFPKSMTLGAIQDDSLIFRMGLEIAHQLRSAGIQVNMAPVADVNSNPHNPVIGMRSFGEDPDNVARKAVAYMKGLQDGGVMAVGKHFPGHGDTNADSHYSLPVVNHSLETLNQVDLKPFRAMINAGLWAVMTAHLEVPAIEPKKGVPTSFSKASINDLLRLDMGFKGLVITDAMNMQGAKVMGHPGRVDALALMAGNDIVEFTEDLPGAIDAVMTAVADSMMTASYIREKVRRALAFKYWLTQVHRDSIVSSENILATVNRSEVALLNRQLYDAALTVLKFDTTHLFVDDKNTAYALIGGDDVFSGQLNQAFKGTIINIPLNNADSFDAAVKRLSEFKKRVLIVADGSWGRKTAHFAQKERLNKLLNQDALVLFMSNPYYLSDWMELNTAGGVILSYQSNSHALESFIRFVSGDIGATGKLPVSVKGWGEVGAGINIR